MSIRGGFEHVRSNRSLEDVPPTIDFRGRTTGGNAGSIALTLKIARDLATLAMAGGPLKPSFGLSGVSLRGVSWPGALWTEAISAIRPNYDPSASLGISAAGSVLSLP